MDNDCLKHGFLGPEKSGKTFAALHMSKNEPVMIRLNPTRETAMSAGAKIVTTKRQLVAAVHGSAEKKRAVICWNISPRMDGFTAFDYACRVAIAFPGRCAVFLNEGESLFSINATLTPAVNQVIRQGRQHCLVPLYWTAQRPRDVNVQLRNNSHTMNFFRNNDESYTKFLREVSDKAAADAVKTLETYAFIQTTSTGEPWKIIKDVKKVKITA